MPSPAPASGPCDPAANAAQLCPRVTESQGTAVRRLSRKWVSPDPLLAHLGVRYLHVGGDWWNRCGEGWLSIDSACSSEGLSNYQIGTDDKGGHNMVVIFDQRLSWTEPALNGFKLSMSSIFFSA